MLEAICARIIPTDANGPGAREARAAHYIDRALGGALSASRAGYTRRPRGVRRLLRSSRRAPFIELSTRDQDSVLIDVETGAATGFHRQLRRVLHDGAHAHAARHVRRSVLRRQRQLRRLGSHRLSRACARVTAEDQRLGAKLTPTIIGVRQRDVQQGAGASPTTRAIRLQLRALAEARRASWRLGSRTPTSSSSAWARPAASPCCRSRRPASRWSASRPARGSRKRDFAPDEIRNNVRDWPMAVQKANQEVPTHRVNA